ncbi:Asp23/Gls24 family envelope stress response protein [Streptacidiphilus sp. PAMC 29251]
MGSGALPGAASPLAQPAPLALPAPADRGSTRLADRVLARIASRAATEVLAQHAADSQRLETPRASASQGRRGVSIRVGLDLPYPADIAAVSREVHRQIVRRVADLAGAESPRITLVVERLVPVAPREGLL